MKKHRHIIILVGITAICFLVVMVLRPINKPKAAQKLYPTPSPATISAPTKVAATPTPAATTSASIVSAPSQLPGVEAQKKMDELYKTAIRFYGRVVDEVGKPIEGANVKIMVADVPFSAGKRFNLTTDAAGLFSLTNAQGASLAVNVSKEGYASLDKSRGLFQVGELQSADDPKMPTAESPAIFVLQSMGKVEPLIKISTFIPVPRNGQPVEINLSDGRVAVTGQGNLRVEAWTNDQAQNAQGRYNWRCKVSVPGGGLVERKSTVFEAPEAGYRDADEIDMPETAERWSSQAQRQYFVKLGTGQYARVQFEMTAQGDHFFSIKSYLNPTAGARNLGSNSSKGK